MDVADVLDAAADYLEEHGWRQGHAGNHGGPRCADGAVESVCDGNALLQMRAVSVADAFVGMALPVFNDAKGRKKPEVVAAFRGAAQQEREGS